MSNMNVTDLFELLNGSWAVDAGGTRGSLVPGLEGPVGPGLEILFKPEVVLIALYVPLIVVSLLANVLLIVVAVKCNYTKNVTNMFVVNLSAADLLVTGVCMPIQLSKAITLVWYYGEAVCKLANYVQAVSVAASVFTLTAMSVDRWASICGEARGGRRRVLALLAALWALALLMFVPLLVVAGVREESVPLLRAHNASLRLETRALHFCTEEWGSGRARQHFGTFSFTVVYAVPGSITIVSYACMGRTLCSARPPFDLDDGNIAMQQQGMRLMKERKRVAWVLLLLAVVFAVCWLPYNILQLLVDVNAVRVEAVALLVPYTLLAGHANSAINPIVYCLMTRTFKRSVHKLLCGRTVCRQTKFTWRCGARVEGSSSDYELYHEPHKRCYLQMNALRQNGVRGTQLSQVTRSSRRAPHLLSHEMLQRHGHLHAK